MFSEMKILACIIVYINLSLFAENIIYPPNSGVIDVTKSPYDVDKFGNYDVTQKLQEILDTYADRNRIIYFPNGTYLVSKTLQYGGAQKRTVLQGQSTEGTIIRLDDNCSDFQDIRNPAGVIWTGEAPAQRFRNSIRNLTVSVGKGNPGASGIQYNSSNQGHIFNVKIVSEGSDATAGLDMRYTNEIGPCLIRNLHVVGFNYGILTENPMNSMTLENITLENQKKLGIYNKHQVMNIRNLKSTNRVTAVYNVSPAVTTVINAELINPGGDTSVPAMRNTSMMFARNIKTTGYNQAIENFNDTTRSKKGSNVTEFVSHEPYSLFPSSRYSLNLPVEESPEMVWPPLSEWESPLEHGAQGDGTTDDTRAVQDAIDAGKSLVYFNGGKTFRIDGTVYLRGNVKRLIGLEGRLSGSGTFVVGNSGPDTVMVQGVDCGGAGIEIKHSSNRTLIIRGVLGMQYVSDGNVGTLFLDDYCINELTFKNQTVYARQLNCESSSTKIFNNGGTLWILGYKTERHGTLCNTFNGGKTEILGSFSYATGDPKTMSMFIDNESDFCLAGHGAKSTILNNWETLVAEKRDNTTKTLDRGDVIPREYDSAIPLFIGFESDETSPFFSGKLSDTTVMAGDTLELPLLAEDLNPGDTLTYSIVQGPQNMEIIDQQTIRWPIPLEAQDATVIIRVEDVTDLAVQDTFTLSINHPPTITSDPPPEDTIIYVGDAFRWNVDAVDLDSHSFTFHLDSGIGSMIVQDVSGLIAYSASLEDTGIHPVTIRVTDSQQGSSYQTFSLRVAENRLISTLRRIRNELPTTFGLNVCSEGFASGKTMIHFAVPPIRGTEKNSTVSGQSIRICLFDMKGKLVAKLFDRSVAAGYYSVPLNAGSSPVTAGGSGLYVVTMHSHEFTTQQKIILSP
ncbi:MAG: hypothetical protein GF401_18125 [Chitinivibrionales bacterium]|nr:hypothetical protein [Chitinivibrionales bacterium]